MRIMRKRYLLKLLFIFFITLSIFSHASAQPWPNDPYGSNLSADPAEDEGVEDDPGGGGHGDPDLPIDSNILILVIAVVGYGLKKAWDVKQNLKRKKKYLQTILNYDDFIK